MLRYMLDTNICIFVIKNRPQHMRAVFNEQAHHMCVSSITIAELMYGAEKSQQKEKNIRVVEDFAARLDIVDFDEEAATHYGEIRSTLEKKGTPIGPYDLMLAGHARSKGLVMVTNNMREFSRVEGLRLEDWSQ
ncbi:tRNA(fMet)-specific endonuclease VapC [Candidatus Terasakiella magnetica]|uniref:Ribonuclease VapC n=1 Tax=Candidatus Terasakiella magnetica TaxID=1867952 RepID=A0A1C3RGC7_9PROT|nr:tRNA(fMet)-specific endonuclease VapC [Candidatus Terasakiella magnetica]SCA56315.1 tRNA(fMet)-specific endonuclease VapC [Candidatus Terasakiella magnetica]